MVRYRIALLLTNSLTESELKRIECKCLLGILEKYSETLIVQLAVMGRTQDKSTNLTFIKHIKATSWL